MFLVVFFVPPAQVHALGALHESSDLLLNVMNVFIMEPLLDWNKPALGTVLVCPPCTARGGARPTALASRSPPRLLFSLW